MTNEEKYKTAEDRIKEFRSWCLSASNRGGCASCKLCHKAISIGDCMAYWLALEAEDEEPMPCPFCGGKTKINKGVVFARVVCECGYHSSDFVVTSTYEAISAHNRVCHAVKATKESEVAE